MLETLEGAKGPMQGVVTSGGQSGVESKTWVVCDNTHSPQVWKSIKRN